MVDKEKCNVECKAASYSKRQMAGYLHGTNHPDQLCLARLRQTQLYASNKPVNETGSAHRYFFGEVACAAFAGVDVGCGEVPFESTGLLSGASRT